MQNKKFKHIESKTITTALEEGKKIYRNLDERLFEEGEITEEQFNNPIYPDEEDLITQGFSFLENNDDYVEVKRSRK